ncbi:Kynurenine 3-monooxygenase [Fusarium oxysporum f. sp. albedinis]|nr:Kynurenine 3-monooxygenase [Fusarium oxysporum f. sp. albedinis]
MEQCREVTEHLTHAWGLGSLLIKRVQRIARYRILILALNSMSDIRFWSYRLSGNRNYTGDNRSCGSAPETLFANSFSPAN